MRYYGCKTKLLGFIEEVVDSLNLSKNCVFLDVFSGTSTVGQHFKKRGYTVYANDFLEFAYCLARTYIQLNQIPEFKNLNKNGDVLNYLNNLKGEPGFITKNYSPYRKNLRMFISVNNAKKVDSIRAKIEYWKSHNLINSDEYYYLLTCLINAINLISNVTGTYAAYLKNWDKRALKEIKLEHAKIFDNGKKNLAIREDANSIIDKYNVDIAYLDPPYNSRQFISNYFFLELITEGWFKNNPSITGKTGVVASSEKKSNYSIKAKAIETMKDLISKANAKYILLSYNDEGIIPIDTIRSIIKNKGIIKEYIREHKRYRAINQDGSKNSVNEYLFLIITNK